MARDTQQPTLSQGNLIYLYQLLSRTIGCGKQTFITRVEEALDSDRMGADELGFASTRDLLEALDAFVTLTVFKGGRIYATVAAQPAWDEALAAAEKGDKATGASSAKPWKRKKGNRALKPIKPKRVKRDPEPTAEAPAAGGGKAAGADGVAGDGKAAGADGAAVATASACDIAAATGSTGNAAATTARGGASATGTGAGSDDATTATINAEATAAGIIGSADADDTVVASADANANGAATATIGADGAAPSPASDRDRKGTDAATGHSGGLDVPPIAGDKSGDRLASDAPATSPAAPEAAPAISLTVTYDPYSGIDEETPLVASGTAPQAPVRNDATGAVAGATVDTTARESTTSEQEKTGSPTPIVRPSARSAQPASAVRNGMPADAQSGTADDQQKPGATGGPQEPGCAAVSHNMHAAVAPPVSGAIASPHATAAPRNAAAPHSSSDAGTSSVSAGAHNSQAVPTVRDIAAPRSSSATATSHGSSAAAPLDARAAAPARDLHAAPTSRSVGTGTDQNVRLNHPAPTEAALRSWPDSFSCDVYCPGEQVAALGALLPFGCDPHTLLAADYQRARDLDLAWGTRGRVTFPLRVEHGDRTAPIEVTLQKRSGTGLPWGLTDVS